LHWEEKTTVYFHSLTLKRKPECNLQTLGEICWNEFNRPVAGLHFMVVYVVHCIKDWTEEVGQNWNWTQFLSTLCILAEGRTAMQEGNFFSNLWKDILWVNSDPGHLSFFFIISFIHMCIQCLGHFYPLRPAWVLNSIIYEMVP
jgi:hypothetical protein